MKQKFRLWKNEKGKNLQIQEYAILTADSRKQKLPGLQDEDFSLLCEQNYQAEKVAEATSKGKDELILFLRNQHFFPIGVYMDLIAEAVMAMYATNGEQHEDLIFDDKKVLLAVLEAAEKESELEEVDEVDSDDDIDELLDDDSDFKGDTSSSDDDDIDDLEDN
jgi:hypothetical protein